MYNYRSCHGTGIGRTAGLMVRVNKGESGVFSRISVYTIYHISISYKFNKLIYEYEYISQILTVVGRLLR